MGEGEECVELKFRIYDGTDICHGTYASSTTVATLKQQLVAEWPQEKTKEEMQKQNSCACIIL
ncbi:hypothetical protein AB3S75_026065 [Citrus x aurantiifolia]